MGFVIYIWSTEMSFIPTYFWGVFHLGKVLQLCDEIQGLWWQRNSVKGEQSVWIIAIGEKSHGRSESWLTQYKLMKLQWYKYIQNENLPHMAIFLL